MPDRDARARGGLEIDIVHSDRKVAHDAQPRRRGEERGVDSVGHHRECSISLANPAAELAVRRRHRMGPQVNACVAPQLGERLRRDLSGDENLRAAVFH